MRGGDGVTYLVTGVSGQDGFYSARHFLKKGRVVVGVSRQPLDQAKPHLKVLTRHPRFQYVDIGEYTKERVEQLIQSVKPDRVVHCAGFRDIPVNDLEVAQCYFTNCDLLEMLLHALRRYTPRARLVFLSSAEIYGQGRHVIYDERSPIMPQNEYAKSKVQGMQLVDMYRVKHEQFGASAICFNHDSFLSPPSHLVRLVPRKLLRLKNGAVSRVVFYDTQILRDWSHASDFVAAFDLLLEQKAPVDYVVASGTATSLSDYISLSCELLGIKERTAVVSEQREDTGSYDRMACSDRLKLELGWRPKTDVRRLCREMIHWEAKQSVVTD